MLLRLLGAVDRVTSEALAFLISYILATYRTICDYRYSLEGLTFNYARPP